MIHFNPPPPLLAIFHSSLEHVCICYSHHSYLSHAISRGLFVGVVYTWTRDFRPNLLSQHCDVTVKLIVRLIDCGWVSSVPSQLSAHLERTVVMARTEEEIKLVQTVSPVNIRQTLVTLLFSLCVHVLRHT